MLYSRQTIMLLMRLCKLLSGEFGIRLHLDDPELISKINKLVASGANPETLAVWREVRGQIALNGPGAAEAAPTSIYQGQEGGAPAAQPEAAPRPESRPKSVRIYRGQIVT